MPRGCHFELRRELSALVGPGAGVPRRRPGRSCLSALVQRLSGASASATAGSASLWLWFSLCPPVAVSASVCSYRAPCLREVFGLSRGFWICFWHVASPRLVFCLFTNVFLFFLFCLFVGISSVFAACMVICLSLFGPLCVFNLYGCTEHFARM